MQHIKRCQQESPDIPLGHAEQFLLTLDSIPHLDCRLKLWLFKLDFEAMEDDIGLPFKCLMNWSKTVKCSETLALIASAALHFGNSLNNSQEKAFHLKSLLNLSVVKDNENKVS